MFVFEISKSVRTEIIYTCTYATVCRTLEELYIIRFLPGAILPNSENGLEYYYTYGRTTITPLTIFPISDAFSWDGPSGIVAPRACGGSSLRSRLLKLFARWLTASPLTTLVPVSFDFNGPLQQVLGGFFSPILDLEFWPRSRPVPSSVHSVYTLHLLRGPPPPRASGHYRGQIQSL